MDGTVFRSQARTEALFTLTPTLNGSVCECTVQYVCVSIEFLQISPFNEAIFMSR